MTTITSALERLTLQIDAVGLKLDDLTSKFNAQESNMEKSGHVYELMVRRELRDIRGQSYARSFKVKDLQGLARLALPKEIISEVVTWNS